MKDLKTCGCLQLSKAISGPTVVREEIWQFQSVIHLNILAIRFRLGLIIPEYSSAVTQVWSAICIIYDPRI